MLNTISCISILLYKVYHAHISRPDTIFDRRGIYLKDVRFFLLIKKVLLAMSSILQRLFRSSATHPSIFSNGARKVGSSGIQKVGRLVSTMD